jgi:hypothetical protein
LVILLLVQGATVSCSKWLDVDSSTKVMEEVLFEDFEGYRTAVNGVYRMLAQSELYGKELTWAALSVLGNNYDETWLPDPYWGDLGGATYPDLASGNYASTYATGVIDPIWERGYSVIANCNNVIAYAEQADPSIFPFGETERDMILGEMLGVRAMMHLDLLRIFAPSTKADDGKMYLPYVTVFPDRQPEHLTVAAALEHVITDLERAKGLLAEVDTVFNAASFASLQYRLYHGNSIDHGTFFSLRGIRLNYFAASAILARAYQWRNGNGDMERAYRAAASVYRFAKVKPWFSFDSGEDYSRVKLASDILFAGFNNKLFDILDGQAIDGGGNFHYKNFNNLFGTDRDDIRYHLTSSDGWQFLTTRWLRPEVEESFTPYEGSLIPLVRLSEAIYIMCEYLADVDLPRAIQLLGEVKVARGIIAPLDPAMTKDNFLQTLYNDMTREFMSEGQTFYLYKRLNEPIYNGRTPKDMTGRYVLPVPYSESAYAQL